MQTGEIVSATVTRDINDNVFLLNLDGWPQLLTKSVLKSDMSSSVQWVRGRCAGTAASDLSRERARGGARARCRGGRAALTMNGKAPLYLTQYSGRHARPVRPTLPLTCDWWCSWHPSDGWIIADTTSCLSHRALFQLQNGPSYRLSALDCLKKRFYVVHLLSRN